jgi:hypothetical protein
MPIPHNNIHLEWTETAGTAIPRNDPAQQNMRPRTRPQIPARISSTFSFPYHPNVIRGQIYEAIANKENGLGSHSE